MLGGGPQCDLTLSGAVLLTMLLAPFFMFAQQELAPKEDQGVVFSILLTSPTSTIASIARRRTICSARG